jgi:hypothetical protein
LREFGGLLERIPDAFFAGYCSSSVMIIILEPHRRGFEHLATICLLIDSVCMMYLNATLG